MTSDISDELRSEVTSRADRRCEYCLIHEQDAGFPHQIDHIVSRKHGGPSTLENLAFACAIERIAERLLLQELGRYAR